MSTANPSKNEGIKESSNFLRGTILEGLADTSTGALSDDDTQLTKFHGIYQQDDRDLRTERRKQKLEKAFSFMVRVRVPGGVCTPEQWLAIDSLADERANGTIKLTTRQAFQLHGILKANLKPAIQGINKSLMDTLAACGDVNRNVMANPNPYQSQVHEQVLKIADQISAHLSPQTSAYHEIWLDDKLVAGGESEEEPIYGKTYLPRKFKIAIAVPPSNDVDVLAHCLGFIAIVEDGQLKGFNISVGGGMGMSHGKEETYPRLADILAFCTPEQVVEVAEKIVTIQRDFGDRENRKHARFKYTVEDKGLDFIRSELEKRLGEKLEDAKPFKFDHNGDRYGWVQDHKGQWHLTLFIQNGYVKDAEGRNWKSALKEVAQVHKGDLRLTANQNLIIAKVDDADKATIDSILEKHGVGNSFKQTALRLNSMACVALPTCGLALAESQRFLPELLNDLDKVIEEAGLEHDAITIRMTGCPNGCARPYLGEIGFVGRAPGKYNIYLGAGFAGERLNKLYRQSVKSDQLVDTLRPIIQDYAKNRNSDERFGDFVIRKDYVAASTNGAGFHENLKEEALKR